MTGSIRGRWLRTRTFVAVASGAVVLATGAATERRTPSSSRRPNPRAPGPGHHRRTARRVRRPRRGRRRRTGGPAPHREQGRPHPCRRVFRRALEDDAQLEYDGTTGTVRILQNLDGYPTGPSTIGPAGGPPLPPGAPRRARPDGGRPRHVPVEPELPGRRRHPAPVLDQEIGGGSVFGSGLQAAVTADGRLLMLGGSPVRPLRGAVRRASEDRLPAGAIAASRRDTGEATVAPGPRDSAERVLFVTRTGTFWGWRTITMSADNPAHSVFDAGSGRLPLPTPALLGRGPGGGQPRQGCSLLPGPPARRQAEDGPVHEARLARRPRHPAVRQQRARLLRRQRRRHRAAARGAPPTSGQRWDYRLQPFHLENVSFCDNPYPCSWNPDEPFSWRVNREQNITQVFYFVNNWHDHLLQPDRLHRGGR